MKVAILTTFYGFDEAYSLCRVVEDQLKMLLRNNIKVVLIANKGFKAKGIWEQVELAEIPSVFTSNEVPAELPQHFESDVEKMTVALREALKDVNVCLTHDIIFQSAHVVHNVAARRIAAENPKIWWLNWVHSTSKPMFYGRKAVDKYNLISPFPNSYLIYPNSGDIKRVAVNFGVGDNDIRVIPHAVDVYDHFKFEQLSIDICERYKLLEADVVGLYPIRLDRGKQPHLIIEIFNALNRFGLNAKLLIVDFHSTGGDKVVYREEMMKRVQELNLSKQINFTSQFSNKTQYSIPHKCVMDLFNISNVFILTSVSETYSLIAQEAALSGNILVLNYDFPPLKTVYGTSPYYFQFSSSINVMTGEDGSTTTTVNDPMNFYGIIAKNIMYELRNNRVLQLKTFVRKERNLQAVFDNFMSPLLANAAYNVSPVIEQKKPEEKKPTTPIVQNVSQIDKVEKVFIIPAYKHFGLLQRNLDSIKKYNENYKVIVIDQTLEGLVQQSYDLSTKDPYIHDIIRPLKFQYGFATSMNVGIRLAREKYFPAYYILCNEDVEFFDAKWWPGIVETFEEYKWKPAGVNPSSPHEPDGKFIKQLKDINWVGGEFYHDQLVKSGAPTIHGICMWCTVIHWRALKDIGELDEKFYPGGGEDYDWNRRAFLKGWLMLGTHRSWAIHWWNRYNKEWGGRDEVEVLPTNTSRIWNNLDEKWGTGSDIYGNKGSKTPLI